MLYLVHVIEDNVLGWNVYSDILEHQFVLVLVSNLAYFASDMYNDLLFSNYN